MRFDIILGKVHFYSWSTFWGGGVSGKGWKKNKGLAGKRIVVFELNGELWEAMKYIITAS